MARFIPGLLLVCASSCHCNHITFCCCDDAGIRVKDEPRRISVSVPSTVAIGADWDGSSNTPGSLVFQLAYMSEPSVKSVRVNFAAAASRANVAGAHEARWNAAGPTELTATRCPPPHDNILLLHLAGHTPGQMSVIDEEGNTFTLTPESYTAVGHGMRVKQHLGRCPGS